MKQQQLQFTLQNAAHLENACLRIKSIQQPQSVRAYAHFNRSKYASAINLQTLIQQVKNKSKWYTPVYQQLLQFYNSSIRVLEIDRDQLLKHIQTNTYPRFNATDSWILKSIRANYLDFESQFYRDKLLRSQQDIFSAFLKMENKFQDLFMNIRSYWMENRYDNLDQIIKCKKRWGKQKLVRQFEQNKKLIEGMDLNQNRFTQIESINLKKEFVQNAQIIFGLLSTIKKTIRVEDEEGNDNFEIIFNFAENPFFADKELRKKFFMKDDYPFKTTGTPINWNEGKDLSKKQVKKKQKNKKTGQNRVISKIVDADTFFNLFRTIELPQGKNPLEFDQNEQLLSQKLDSDFELGGAIIDECVPYSLQYYLGVKAEGEDDEDDEDDDDDEEDDDEEDDEPKKSKQKKPKSKAAPGANQNVQKPECKQQ